MMRKTYLLSVVSCAVTVLSWSQAVAQEHGKCRPEADAAASRAAPPTAEPARLSLVDRRIVPALVIDCSCEMDLAVFAATRARDNQVREFAEQLAKEYGGFTKALNQRSTGHVAVTYKKSSEEETSGPTEGGAAASGKTPSRPPLNLLNPEKTLLRIKAEVALEWTLAVRQDLESTPPAEFDRHFLRRSVSPAANAGHLESSSSVRVAGTCAGHRGRDEDHPGTTRAGPGDSGSAEKFAGTAQVAASMDDRFGPLQPAATI